MQYKITYANRKTLAIYIRKDGEVEVRAPKHIGFKEIDNFVESKQAWIEKVRNKFKKRIENKTAIVNEDKSFLITKANNYIPMRVKILSEMTGLCAGNVTITLAKSYWGCCNKEHDLRFSWRLMLASDKTIDYVIIHELAHTKFYNHSDKFWQEVKKHCPYYKDSKKELKDIQIKYE